jgi:hypothetical protein
MRFSLAEEIKFQDRIWKGRIYMLANLQSSTVVAKTLENSVEIALANVFVSIYDIVFIYVLNMNICMYRE